MALTKAQARTLIRNLLTDENSQLWTAAVLDVLIQTTIDGLWELLLTANPFYTRQVDGAPAVTSPGYVVLGSGGLSLRFHKLHSVVREQVVYTPTHQDDLVLDGNTEVVAPPQTYAIFGNQLWLFPLALTPVPVISYAYKPPLFTGLADTADVVWPDGHENAYVFAVASLASVRGGAQLRQEYQLIADAALQSTLEFVRHRDNNVTVPRTFDSAEQWSGNA